jgi:hypothetical protein
MPPRPLRDRLSAPPAPIAVAVDDQSRQDAAARTLQAAAKSPVAKARRRTLPPGSTAPSDFPKAAPPASSASGGGSRSTKMTVGVRVRPLSARETKRGSHSCLTLSEGKHVFAHDPDDKMGGIDYLRLDKNKDKGYQFDHAFGPDETTEQVYDKTVKKIISAVMDGFQGSCFAYGATGSGKTCGRAARTAAPPCDRTVRADASRMAPCDVRRAIPVAEREVLPPCACFVSPPVR